MNKTPESFFARVTMGRRGTKQGFEKPDGFLLGFITSFSEVAIRFFKDKNSFHISTCFDRHVKVSRIFIASL